MSTTVTNFTPNVGQSDKSDKTVKISNSNFLQAIFGDCPNREYPIFVSFHGDPTKVLKHSWSGQPWNPTTSMAMPENANNYFSLACFKPNEVGEYRRRKAQFVGLFAVMLDDIGTKVPMERLTLAPSWLLETSPGNYQAGYILVEPINNSKVAENLVNAIINAGLCDPGANGPTARLARLPVAVNGKHKPEFHCQLESWEPQKRYSIEELIDGLQLEMVEKKVKSNTRQTEETNDADCEEIWSPCPKENAILTALRDQKLYKTPLGECKHDITCPWVNEHTHAIDSGTAYFEPDDNYPIGGFKCLHGHCSNRHIRDLLRFLNVDVKAARMKPTIRVIKGELHRIVDMAERELALGQQYFQRGGIIVRVYTDPSTHETLIQSITQPALVRALSGIASWEQYDNRPKKWVRIDPPPRHTSILFDSSSYRHLPVINGLARQPYLRPDGSLMEEASYDSSTGIFGVFDSRKYTIPENPTRKDAEAALSALNTLLDEFCFATPADHSAALAAILTASIRPSLDHAPMFHVKAHAVGSGKSYLCALISAFATSQRGTPTTFPADDEECRKLLLAELLRSPAVIEFDNLTSDILPHKSLCTALTSEHMTGRILGVSKTATVGTRTLFLSSGNNVSPIKDMARRCITINLNPETEIPAAREFKRPNLIDEISQNREVFVGYAITIVRAWILAGRPQSQTKPLAGFLDWSDLCRQSLLWLGQADPAASIFAAIKEDPDREILGRLLHSWESAFGNTPTMVRDAVKKSLEAGHETNELKECLHEIADERGEINRRRLGRWIKRHEGQIVDGLRFVRTSGNTSAERWQVESVSSVSSVSRGQNEEICAEEEYRRAAEGE